MYRDQTPESRLGSQLPGALARLLEAVKLRAYEVYRDRVARGAPGDEEGDWRTAERDVLTTAGLLAAPAEPAEDQETSLLEPDPVIPGSPAGGENAALERVAAALGALTARDVMHGRLATVEPDCTLGQLARTLDERGVPAVPVVDGHQRLLGVVSVTDLVHGAALAQASAASLPAGDRIGSARDQNRVAGEMLAAVRVGEVFSRALVAAPPEATLLELAGLMTGHRVHQVVIVDENRIAGLVTALDLVCALYSRYPASPHYTVP